MQVAEFIRQKRDNEPLSAADIKEFIQSYTKGEVPDYQVSAFLMAVFFRGMSDNELSAWTDAMLHSGDVVDLSSIAGFKVDKHSTGGVGDKVSLILAPLVAAAGVPVPMISGRGLGHTGGTLDKLESIPGFRTNLSLDRFRDLVATLGCGLIGQTEEIAPADKRLYALRDVTSTVECVPLIASSIMSKKLAEGIDGLVLDVKTGSGAFMSDLSKAKLLAETMIGIGKLGGKKISAYLTDMDQPLGNMIGNSLEVIESVEVLRGKGPEDLRELTLILSAEMLTMATGESREAAKVRLAELLDNGAAFERFRQIVEAQHGNPASLVDYSLLPTADHVCEVVAEKSGYVSKFRCKDLGRAAVLLGAGRMKKEDAVDPAVGMVLRAKRGDFVEAGDSLCTIHYNSTGNLAEVQRIVFEAFILSDLPPASVPLVVDRILFDD